MQFRTDGFGVGQLPADMVWLAPEQLAGLVEGDPFTDWPPVPGTSRAGTLLSGPPPTYHVDSQTGKGGALLAARLPTVHDQTLLTFDPLILQDWTIFVIGRTLTGGVHGPTLFDHLGGFQAIGVSEAGPYADDNTGTLVVNGGVIPALGELWFWGARRQGDQWSIWRNGAELAVATGPTDPATLNALVAFFGATTGGYCWIPEVIAIPAALPLDQDTAFWSYLANKYRKDDAMLSGVVLQFAGPAVPSGYLPCDGAAVNRLTYPELFSAIGTLWGAGDGSTTFNVPDLRDRSPLGASPGGLGSDRPTVRALGAYGGEESHQLTTAELAAHVHGLIDPGHQHGVNSGGNYLTDSGFSTGDFYGSGGSQVKIDAITAYASTGATVDSAGGGGPHNNLQPFAVVNWIIKT